MAKFISLEYKNIQSVGNTPIKIQLDRNPTTLIGGDNGSGKSTMLYALAYGLYGRFLSGAKLGDVINSTNKKSLLVKVTFRQRGKEYVVVRGEKPKKFEVYEDGEMWNQDASARDLQKKIDLLLGYDYDMFTQVVLLNKERYKPFMSMGAAERRKVVEEIFGVSIFSTMNTICKDMASDVKADSLQLQRKVELGQQALESQKRLIQTIHDSIESANQDTESEVSELRTKIEDYETKVSDHEADIESKRTALSKLTAHRTLSSRVKELTQLSMQFSTESANHKKTIAFFNSNDVCPTCSQHIEDEKKDSMIGEAQERIDEISSASNDMIAMLEETNKQLSEIEELNNQIMSVEREIQFCNRQIRDLNEQIGRLSAKTDNDGQKRLQKALDEYDTIKADLDQVTEKYEEVLRQMELFESMKTLLKDDGVKSMIIREYITLINKKVNEYLYAMNFYINIELDENFNEKFHAMHKENFSMANLSTGQKTRVNLAIWLALLEVASIKNSVVSNVLLLDEILEPFDANGVKDFMALCRELLADKNIFIITQRFEEFSDYFRGSIRFKLNDGFTEIEK